MPEGQPSVLVLGVYMAGRANAVRHLVDAMRSSQYCRVFQRWVALGGPPPDDHVGSVTVVQVAGRVAKFSLVNRMLHQDDVDQYDFILVCDDDVYLPDQWVDRFIGWQQHCNFALAQPARTWDSFVDHTFVRRALFTRARETRFVEIGPVFCMARAMARLILPFDETSDMGWGYDLVWPVIARANGLTLGIVDDAPVAHSMRPRGAFYEMAPELESMRTYLANNEHLKARECFTTLRRYR